MTPAAVVLDETLRRLLELRIDLDAAIEVADTEDLPSLVDLRYQTEQQIRRRLRPDSELRRCG